MSPSSQRSFSHSHNTLMMPDSQDPFTQATELVEQDQLDDAFALFLALIKIDSNNATIWNNIGIIRFRQGEYREAVNAFGQANKRGYKNTKSVCQVCARNLALRVG